MIDKDGNGKLSLAELEYELDKLGYSADEISAWFHHADTDNSGDISYDEFASGMLHRLKKEGKGVVETKALFHRYHDAEGGGVAPAQMVQLITQCGVREDKAQKMVEEIVEGGDKLTNGHFGMDLFQNLVQPLIVEVQDGAERIAGQPVDDAAAAVSSANGTDHRRLIFEKSEVVAPVIIPTSPPKQPASLSPSKPAAQAPLPPSSAGRDSKADPAPVIIDDGGGAAERMLALKAKNEAASGNRQVPTTKGYTLIVFQGGTSSIASIPMTPESKWSDFLGEMRSRVPDRKVYAIAYVDPSEADAKAKLVRGDAEWGQCIEVLKRERDHELEVDLLDQPPIKPYKLSLKVGKKEKKKISYPNPYDREVTFKLSSSSPSMSLKDDSVTIPSGEKVAPHFPLALAHPHPHAHPHAHGSSPCTMFLHCLDA